MIIIILQTILRYSCISIIWLSQILFPIEKMVTQFNLHLATYLPYEFCSTSVSFQQQLPKKKLVIISKIPCVNKTIISIKVEYLINEKNKGYPEPKNARILGSEQRGIGSLFFTFPQPIQYSFSSFFPSIRPTVLDFW